MYPNPNDSNLGKGQTIPGFPCPECNNHIPISIIGLLAGNSPVCPGCGLNLTLDQRRSKEGLMAAKKLNAGLAKAKIIREEGMPGAGSPALGGHGANPGAHGVAGR